MKKILSVLLVCSALTTALASCTTRTDPHSKIPAVTDSRETQGEAIGALPEGMSGTEAARLLLAEERLNAKLLRNEGNIFEDGVAVMNNLAKTAMENLNIPRVGRKAPSVTPLASTQNLSTELKGTGGGKVVIDGDTYTWSDFVENNNSYDYFENLTGNIVHNAEMGADLIDNVKKYVRIVDKWVAFDESTKYYLHVEENMEYLIERYTGGGFDLLKICKRSKNADGKDVYELYHGSADTQYEERMTYIPGERYELSMEHQDAGTTYFVADNAKGYWETYVLTVAPQHYNASYFIMKDDICYDGFYNPKDQWIPLLKVMSADKATDILNISGGPGSYSIDLKFSGFDGIVSVEAPASSVELAPDGTYAILPSGDGSRVHTASGKDILYGETYLDGKVSVDGIHAMYAAGDIYTGEMILHVKGMNHGELLASLKAFLNEFGLTCRRDINSVFEGIARAYSELDSIIEYYTWNGISVTTEEKIAQAIDVEKTRFDEMKALYTAVQHDEVLDYSNTEVIELNINFAPITALQNSGTALDGTAVTVENIALTITDTTLYVKDQPYKVMFALIAKNGSGGLVHPTVTHDETVNYADEAEFTVTASDVRFELPTLAFGDYTIVAYIATDDGIRSSGYIPVGFNTVADTVVDIENTRITARREADGSGTVSYTELVDFTINLTSETKQDYQAFRQQIATEVFRYGTPDEGFVEMQSGETYTPLTGTETEIADGTYRLGYSVQNGEAASAGYVYVVYTIKEADTGA